MVSGDHEEIALPHSGDEVGHELVKLGGSGSIACYIAAVAVEHIEVHQIHKGKALKVAGLQCLGEGDAIGAVSYTHLDVYKRQALQLCPKGAQPLAAFRFYR